MQGSMVVLTPLLVLGLVVLAGLPIGMLFAFRERAAQATTRSARQNGVSRTPAITAKVPIRETRQWSDALRVRDVDALVSALLERIGVPVASQSKKLAVEVKELKEALN